MSTSTTPSPVKPFDYQAAAETVLKLIRRDRDRQIIARRFGFGLPRRQTLEQIGRDFGITRERVRQIEQATMARLKGAKSAEITTTSELLRDYITAEGGVMLADTLVERLGATDRGSRAYVLFLASLATDIELLDDSDQLRQIVIDNHTLDSKKVRELTRQLVAAVKDHGKPATLDTIAAKLQPDLNPTTVASLANASKDLACFEDKWGLVSWPAVNPRSIRDKTYLVLRKHQKPLHFSEIARHIKESDFARRDVTVQAVHNELIKDPRFILIGRGIYALAEWGYTPGTVADIIIDILKQESPLHKDEIVRRVLEKRQVKTTTIILNLQEKSQFERTAKATYKLKDK